MAQPGISVKSLVSSYETRVVGMAPGPPRKRGCASSPCSPRGASPIRGTSGPPPHRGLGGPGQRPSARRGMDKTLLSLILYCHSGSGSLVGIDNKIEQAMPLRHWAGDEAPTPLTLCLSPGPPGFGEVPPHVCGPGGGGGTEGADPGTGRAERCAGAGERAAARPGQPGAAGSAALLGGPTAWALRAQWALRLSLPSLTMCLWGCPAFCQPPAPSSYAALMSPCPQGRSSRLSNGLFPSPCPISSSSPALMEEGGLQDGASEGAPSGREPTPTLPHGTPSSRRPGGVGGSLADTPPPPCSLEVHPLLCPGEGVWTVSGSSGIQVVIKIIIIIKNSEET
ncbi:TSC22 domain family protein 4 isoform X2 [Theropithecus gelada]|uniref:TSC22 domain family protein 4 isoform X2 n=1 Tax=Theropithecus gelada TaxID=9565 RepID=UPI000DC1AA6B|nr:TSC22 domain family protein 4 isoform X2 [Theropithecus gelada]